MKKRKYFIFVIAVIFLFTATGRIFAQQKISKEDRDKLVKELEEATTLGKKIDDLRKISAPTGANRFEHDKKILKEAFPDINFPEPPKSLEKKFEEKIRQKTKGYGRAGRKSLRDENGNTYIILLEFKDLVALENIFGKNYLQQEKNLRESPLFNPLLFYLKKHSGFNVGKNISGEIKFTINKNIFPIDFLVHSECPKKITKMDWLRKKACAFVNFFRTLAEFGEFDKQQIEKSNIFIDLKMLQTKRKKYLVSIWQTDDRQDKTKFKVLLYFSSHGKILLKDQFIDLAYFSFVDNNAKANWVFKGTSNFPTNNDVMLRINKLLDKSYLFLHIQNIAPITILSISTKLHQRRQSL